MGARSVLMGVVFALMWSSAFATARVIVAHAPPLASLCLRFLLSGVLAVAVARWMGQSWRLPAAQWRSVILFGLCQNAAYLGLNFVALQEVPAALAAIIASGMPLIVAGLSVALGRERIGGVGLAGLLLGFAGVVLIMADRVTGGVSLWGVGLCLAGALALAVATITLVSASGTGGNHLMVVGLQMLVGALALGGISAASERLWLDLQPALLAAFAYQVLVPGLAATLIWFALVERIGTIRASAFHFLNPAFGAGTAALLLGERLTGHDVLGVVIIMAGILLVQISRRPKSG